MISKEEAYEILGVTGKSMDSEIEQRYSILIKRYRSEKNIEKLDELTLAYNIIKGTHFEPIQENPRMQKVIFGKTRSEWQNIFYYGKTKYFAILLAVVFVGWVVYTMVTNTPADFSLAEVGEFSVTDSDTTEAYILEMFPQFKKVEIMPVYLSEEQENTQAGIAYTQKAMIVFSVGGEDVIVVDRNVFDKYAPLGAFLPLGDLYEALLAMDETKDLGLKSVKTTVAEDSSGVGTEEIYGIDVSESQLLNSIGIYGSSQILTISVKSTKEALAKEFITKLFRDSARLLPNVTWIPTATPAPVSSSETTSVSSS
jgi:hypothetical protein